jgi:signal transduction histidine kinase
MQPPQHAVTQQRLAAAYDLSRAAVQRARERTAAARQRATEIRHALWDAQHGDCGAAYDCVRTRATELTAAEALRAVEERDRFLAVVSHELRHPVNATIAALRVMDLGGEDGPKARTVLHRQLLLISKLLDDLLDLSRLTLKAANLHIRRMEIAPVLESVLARLEPQARSNDQTVTLSLADVPVWVDGDATRLHQVFMNLLSNAIRYTPEGGRIVVTMSAARDTTAIDVSDSGRGMSARELRDTFSPFVRGDGSDGLGIGLAIVRGIVELHGGTVRVASDGRGRGCVFTVTLPLRGAPAPETDHAGTPERR